MKYSYKNQEFKAYTLNQLILELNKIEGCSKFASEEGLNFLFFEKNNIQIMSDNPKLVKFLNTEFDIRTDHDFANRSAKEFCSRHNGYKMSDLTTILSYGDFLLRLFEHAVKEVYELCFIHCFDWYKGPNRRPTDQEIAPEIIELLKVFCNPFPKPNNETWAYELGILSRISDYRPWYNLIEYYSKRAKWCDEITSNNINTFFHNVGIVGERNNISMKLFEELDMDKAEHIIEIMSVPIPVIL